MNIIAKRPLETSLNQVNSICGILLTFHPILIVTAKYYKSNNT